MVGEWLFEAESIMGPDDRPGKLSGTESVRSLGGLWYVAEARTKAEDGKGATSILTIGYDPQRDAYVGTFVSSMMPYLWVYEGALDAPGKVLMLDTEGPDPAGDRAGVRYRDPIMFQDDDRRLTTSQMLGDDGTGMTSS